MPPKQQQPAPQKNDLDKLIDDISDLASRIRSIDTLILSIDNPELKQQYVQDLLGLTDSYKRLLTFLESQLSDHAKLEREQNLVVNIRYRRILKQLQSKSPRRTR